MNSSIELRWIKSLTTATDILKGEGQFIEVAEYSERTLSIEIKGESLANDQLVSLSGRIRLEEKTLPFEAIGKIIATQALPPTTRKIEIYLNQFDKKLWASFLHHKQEAQNKADELFKKIKGDI